MAADTTRIVTYADGRSFRLGDTWYPLDERVRDVAVERILAATSSPALGERVARYYDPNGNYTGSLVATLEPNPTDDIVASDLLAVSTLSMRLEPLQVRQLLDPKSERRRVVERCLRSIPLGLPITSLDDDDPAVQSAVDHMWDLYNELRLLLADRTPGTNRWVFASKLCARKRPDLFPVRDNVVCAFLSESGRLTGKGMGRFSNDIQVFAYAMSLPQVREGLGRLREELSDRGVAVADSDLRLLDVVLWTEAVASGTAQVSESAGSGAM